MKGLIIFNKKVSYGSLESYPSLTFLEVRVALYFFNNIPRGENVEDLLEDKIVRFPFGCAKE